MNIIITGASKGLGKAIAEKFAAEKYTLFLCARHEKRFSANKAGNFISTQCRHYSLQSRRCKQKKEVKQFAEWIMHHTDTIDILMNNAGKFLPGNIGDEQDGTLEQMIETNLYGAYYLTKALLSGFLKQHYGHIFNMCSIASLQAYNNGGSYSISKFALAGFSKIFAKN